MPQIAAFIDFKHRIDIPAAIGERRAEQIIFPLPLIRKDKRVPNMNLIRCYRFYRPKSLFHRIDQLSFPLLLDNLLIPHLMDFPDFVQIAFGLPVIG